jgi:hypothetical protein
LVHFPAHWHILWPFGIFTPVLVHFTRFGMLHQEKSGNPVMKADSRQNYRKPLKFFKFLVSDYCHFHIGLKSESITAEDFFQIEILLRFVLFRLPPPMKF